MSVDVRGVTPGNALFATAFLAHSSPTSALRCLWSVISTLLELGGRSVVQSKAQVDTTQCSSSSTTYWSLARLWTRWGRRSASVVAAPVERLVAGTQLGCITVLTCVCIRLFAAPTRLAERERGHALPHH